MDRGISRFGSSPTLWRLLDRNCAQKVIGVSADLLQTLNASTKQCDFYFPHCMSWGGRAQDLCQSMDCVVLGK